MNHEDVKQLLLKDRATREAYARPPQALVVARTVVLRRRELGMTKEMLAEKLGATIDDISEIESGHDQPSREMLMRLATVLQEPGLQAIGLREANRPKPVRYTSQTTDRRGPNAVHGKRMVFGRNLRKGSANTGHYIKRDASTGRFMDVKRNGIPSKGVRKKK